MQKQSLIRFGFIHGIALVLATLVMLSGCAAKYQVTRAAGYDLPPCALDSIIEVINRGSTSQEPFQILGKVFVEKSYGGWRTRNRDEDIVHRLKVAACSLGADAMIDVHIYATQSGFNSDVVRWSSGLAVTLGKGPPEIAAVDFIIVLPKVTGPSLGQLEAIRQYVQYELENRGYYAMVADDSLSASSLALLSPTELSTMSGGLASQVMLIEYELAAKGETEHTIRASLVDNTSRNSIWENEVRLSPGANNSDNDPDVILTPNDATIRRGVRKLISSLSKFATSANSD